jgi:hypothetical protein
VRPQPGDLIARLTLKPDRAAQQDHDRQPQKDLAISN